MNAEEIRNYILEKNDVTESFPFGNNVLVFKTKGKIFLLLSLDEAAVNFNVKCEPEKAIELRDEYPDVITPGYHMNKKHWNTVLIGTGAPEGQLRELIDHSYELVRASLPKAAKATLEI